MKGLSSGHHENGRTLPIQSTEQLPTEVCTITVQTYETHKHDQVRQYMISYHLHKSIFQLVGLGKKAVRQAVQGEDLSDALCSPVSSRALGTHHVVSEDV